MSRVVHLRGSPRSLPPATAGVSSARLPSPSPPAAAGGPPAVPPRRPDRGWSTCASMAPFGQRYRAWQTLRHPVNPALVAGGPDSARLWICSADWAFDRQFLEDEHVCHILCTCGLYGAPDSRQLVNASRDRARQLGLELCGLTARFGGSSVGRSVGRWFSRSNRKVVLSGTQPADRPPSHRTDPNLGVSWTHWCPSHRLVGFEIFECMGGGMRLEIAK